MYYNIYRGQDGVIDHETVQATMDLDDEDVAIPDQVLPPNTIWHYVRRLVSDCELESADSDPTIIRIDGDGEMIPLTPNAPLSLQIEQVAGGKLQLRWRYSTVDQEVAPTGFHIFIDSGSGFDFQTPDDTVPYYFGGNGEFSWTSEVLTPGQRYRFCVRSYADRTITAYRVTGELAPGATGDYIQAGLYDGVPYYRRADGAYHIWYFATFDIWHISVVLGESGTAFWQRGDPDIAGDYSPGGTATGIASVGNAPCGESENANYVSAVVDASGPPAAIGLAATWEADA